MKRLLLLLGLLAVGGPARLIAQCSTPNGQANGSCSSNIASSLTIPTLIRLTISDTSTSLTTPTEADYDATQTAIASSGPVATIKTNSPWTLLVRATSATWTGTGGARTNKPVGDLLWSTGGGYSAMTTANVSVATGSRGSANSRTFTYKTNWAWTLDTPGTYTVTVIFTATAP